MDLQRQEADSIHKKDFVLTITIMARFITNTSGMSFLVLIHTHSYAPIFGGRRSLVVTCNSLVAHLG